jgi:hypothetical protein
VPIALQATAVSATASPVASSYGSPVLLQATVSSTTSSTTSPTGTVAFSLGGAAGASLCTATLAAATAACSTTSLPAGTDLVTASYSGDSTHSAATGVVQVTVGRAPSIVTLLTSVTQVVLGAPVILTATVSGASATGTVTFSEGTTVLCAGVPLNGGIASCSTTAILPGSGVPVTVTYSGGPDISPSSATSVVNVAYPLGMCTSAATTPGCNPSMLISSSSQISMTAGSSTNVSVLYASWSALTTNNGALAGAVYQSGAVVATAKVMVTPLLVLPSFTAGFSTYIAILSLTVPSTLAPGTYQVAITAHDRAAQAAQHTWSLSVTKGVA